MNWYVYMIRCDDDSLYTGITDDVERRIMQHAGRRGAKYFRGRQPTQVVYLESGHSRRSAAQREAAIKKLRRPAKDCLIASAGNKLVGEP
jgi:putative endonuclease